MITNLWDTAKWYSIHRIIIKEKQTHEENGDMRNLIAAALATFVLLTFGTITYASSYEHEVEASGVSFAWKVEGDTLHAKMSAKTKGWVAVGFNPSKKMKDANFILGYVKGGKGKVADHFGDKATGHVADKKKGGSEDVTLVSGTEEGGVTTIEFTMPMNSGDKTDGALSKDGDTILLLAYGPDRDSFKPRHKKRATLTINLGSGAKK